MVSPTRIPGWRRYLPQPGYALALLGVIALAAVVHFWRLGSLPPGMFIDEASIGYNAWSLALTGADEHGRAWPLFCRCFGNHQDPVMVYSLAALLRFVPLSLTVCRVPSAAYHLLAALAFGLLAWEYTRQRWWALAGGAWFALLPWVLPLSRSVFSGYTPFLLGLNLGWFCLLRAAHTRSLGMAFGAAAAWAFAMYSHNVARPQVALLLVGFALLFAGGLWSRRGLVLSFAGTLIALLLPLTWVVWRDHRVLTERFQEISVWRDHPGALALVGRLTGHYLEYFSPAFLFFRGDDNERHHSGFGGELWWFFLPLVLAGLWAAWRRARRHPACRFLLLSLVCYPLSAILTIDRQHATRSLAGATTLCLLAVLGAAWLWHRGPAWRRATQVLLVLGALNVAGYLGHYFGGAYERYAANAFDQEINQALATAFAERRQGEPVYFSATFFYDPVTPDFRPFRYAQILFHSRLAPAYYQRYGLPPELVRPYRGQASGPGLLLRANVAGAIRPGQVLLLQPSPEPVPAGARLLAAIRLLPRTLGLNYPGAQGVEHVQVAPGIPPPALEIYRLP